MGRCSKVAALAIIFGTWGCAAQSTASNNSSDSSAGSSSAVSEPTLTPSSSSSGQDALPVSSAVAESTSSSSTPSSSSSSSGVAPQQSPAWLASVTPLTMSRHILPMVPTSPQVLSAAAFLLTRRLTLLPGPLHQLIRRTYKLLSRRLTGLKFHRFLSGKRAPMVP